MCDHQSAVLASLIVWVDNTVTKMGHSHPNWGGGGAEPRTHTLRYVQFSFRTSWLCSKQCTPYSEIQLKLKLYFYWMKWNSDFSFIVHWCVLSSEKLHSALDRAMGLLLIFIRKKHLVTLLYRQAFERKAWDILPRTVLIVRLFNISGI
jgi:hypothetical protein